MKKLLSLLLLLNSALFAKTLYIAPYPGSRPEVTFYNARSSIFAQKWVALREEIEKLGYEVGFTFDGKELKDFAGLISITNINPELLKNLAHYPKERCWLLAFEPHVFMPKIYEPAMLDHFGKIFVMFDDLVDNKNYFKFFYPQTQLTMNASKLSFAEKKFCALLAANKHSSHPQELYSERLILIDLFSKLEPLEFDLYGIGWEGYKAWRGIAKHKWRTLENYKFCISYENMGDNQGYITEKIFDCFVAGCVPIYLGASNISNYIPAECFIDRRHFESNEALYSFLMHMSEERHAQYVRSIQAFLASPQAQLFSVENFIKIIKDQIKQQEKRVPKAKMP